MLECSVPHSIDGQVWCGASQPPTRISVPHSRHRPDALVQILDGSTPACALTAQREVVDSELIPVELSELSAEVVAHVAQVALGYNQYQYTVKQ